jgi:hypothetical protein
MKRVFILLATVAALALAPTDAAARDLTGAYPAAELKKDGTRLGQRVRQLFDVIKPMLTDAERDKLEDVALFFPEPRKGDYFLNFYAVSQDGRAVVVMPMLSLKVLEDLATAYAWLYVNGYSLSTVDLYFAMLQHRDKADFPGGEYPPLLEALGIPEDAWQQPRVDKLSLSFRNEALAFILLHELGHILFAHKGYDEITRAQSRRDETQSDRFALDVLARSNTPPLGAMMFFQAQFYSLPTKGEFDTPGDWQDYLREKATHPLTEDRLRALSRYITNRLAQRRGIEYALWQFIGLRLNQIIGILQDTDLQRCIIRMAKEAPLDILRPRRQTAEPYMQRYCRDLD